MAERKNLLRDILYFIKTDLRANITDPLSRTGNWVFTSYPQKNVVYPIITIKIPNIEATRAGMQVDRMDMKMVVEVRIWARNEKEKDTLYDEIMDRLATIQFSTSGSVDSDFHDFNILSSVEVDEDGETGTKSRILQVEYKFYNL